MEILITLHKNVSKLSDRKSKNLVRLVLCTADEWNGHLKNVLDVDLKITYCKISKPPKDNEKRKKQVSFYGKGNHARGNSENNSDQKIYASMARISNNDKYPSGNFGGSLQLTNWILYSGAT